MRGLLYALIVLGAAGLGFALALKSVELALDGEIDPTFLYRWAGIEDGARAFVEASATGEPRGPDPLDVRMTRDDWACSDRLGDLSGAVRESVTAPVEARQRVESFLHAARGASADEVSELRRDAIWHLETLGFDESRLNWEIDRVDAGETWQTLFRAMCRELGMRQRR